MLWRSTAREVENPVRVDLQRRGDVVLDEPEVRILAQRFKVVETAGDEIVDREYRVALAQQPCT